MGRINFNEYGVSFKGIPDEVVSGLNNHTPIITYNGGKTKNLIIEGENLHSLIALLPESKNKINEPVSPL